MNTFKTARYNMAGNRGYTVFRLLWPLVLSLAVGSCSSSGNGPTESDSAQDAPATDIIADSLDDRIESGNTDQSQTPDGYDSRNPDSSDDAEVLEPPEYEHDPAKVELAGPCPLETKIGTFKLEANEDVGYTAVDGLVRNGVIPSMVPDQVTSEGGCSLLRERRLICDPVCSSGQTCGLDETCMPVPLGQDVGTVIISGLEKVLALEPLQPGNKYSFSKLKHPGFEVGRVIHVSSKSGYLGPFEMYGVGVAQAIPVEEKWVLTSDQPLTIHWETPPIAARSTVFLEFSIDLHGLTALRMECELPDTGEATVPANLIGELVAAGVTGFPVGSFTRRTADSIVVQDQCVEFLVTSVRMVNIEVSGHVPCSTDEECPSPLTCNTLIEQCE